MNITPRVLLILRILRRYKFVTTALIRDWCVPNDKDGSITREVMRKMLTAGLVRRFKAEVHNPLTTPSVPVWIPTEAGCCLLAAKTGDASLILDALPNTNNWTQFAHFVAVSAAMHAFDAAFAAQSYATIHSMYFEHDVVSDSKEPEKRFRLHTLVRNDPPKRTVCVPDAAFEVAVGTYRRAYYFELERGTDTPKRVAAKKSPGYALMQNHFRKCFPDAQDWRVLFVWPNAGLRDAARHAVDPAKSENWLFAALPDLAGAFLHQPVVYTATDGPKPFIKVPTTPATTPLPYKIAE